jgi:cobalt/nickel transport system permease protein
MHVPDGFLDAPTSVATGVIAVGGVALALRGARRELDDRTAPMAGLVATFVFAGQMMNFPVAGGTSGHFLGAALAAILLGPWLACLVLAVVLLVQAFLFADGGVSALGANVLNMGVVGALGAGLVMGVAMRVLPRTRRAFLGATAVASWLAVVAGAIACSFELALSGTVPLGTVLPAMVGVHALIGVGEAVVTVAAVSAVLVSRPDLVAVAPPEVARAPAPAAGEVTA